MSLCHIVGRETESMFNGVRLATNTVGGKILRIQTILESNSSYHKNHPYEEKTKTFRKAVSKSLTLGGKCLLFN